MQLEPCLADCAVPPVTQDAAPLSGELAAAIKAQWGSQEAFVSTFNAKTAAVQGSGWGWLGYNAATKGLEIATCANQDPLAAKVRSFELAPPNELGQSHHPSSARARH